MKISARNRITTYFQRLRLSLTALAQAGLIFGFGACSEKADESRDSIQPYVQADRAPIQYDFKGTIGDQGEHPEPWSFNLKSPKAQSPQKSGTLSLGKGMNDLSEQLVIAGQPDGSVVLTGTPQECAFGSTCSPEQSGLGIQYRPGSIEGTSQDGAETLTWDLKVTALKRGEKLIEGEIRTSGARESEMTVDIRIFADGNVYGRLYVNNRTILMGTSIQATTQSEIAPEAVVTALLISAVRYSADRE